MGIPQESPDFRRTKEIVPMKWLPVTLALLALGFAAPAMAQRPGNAEMRISAGTGISPGELKPTPEMWFYEQSMLQHLDPKTGVRQKAEFRSTQRMSRVASRQWFGFSNSRPLAASDPFNGEYSPHWTSNNFFYPSRWAGTMSGPVTVPTSTSSTF
jgi:hypothetical protein